MEKRIREAFIKHFGTVGNVYTSPGRINIIGEHTDYNGGFVFPGAIDKGIMAMIRMNTPYLDWRKRISLLRRGHDIFSEYVVR